METQQLRALRTVFYAAGRALKAAPKSDSHKQFEAMMAARWTVFCPVCVLPCISARGRLVFAPGGAVKTRLRSAEHQRGYWQAGAMRRFPCLRRLRLAALEAEIDATAEGSCGATCGRRKDAM